VPLVGGHGRSGMLPAAGASTAHNEGRRGWPAAAGVLTRMGLPRLSSDCKIQQPRPFVRKLRLHMDCSPATNNSQFFCGNLGLLLSCDLLDCAMVLYMILGHKQFGLDMVTLSLTGGFHRSDAFTHRFFISSQCGCFGRTQCQQLTTRTRCIHG